MVWAFIHSYSYISESVSSGQLVISGNEYDITNFYMANSVQYVIFAVLMFGIGWMIFNHQSSFIEVPSNKSADLTTSQNDDDDLDEWFEEISQKNNLSKKD